MKNKRLFVLTNVGVVLGMGAAMVHRSKLLEFGNHFAPNQMRMVMAALSPPSPAVTNVVNKHFEWAKQQEAAGLGPQLVPIETFFKEARAGTRAFAQEALDFDSKWRYVQDFLMGGDDHRRYLEQRFTAHVFSADELEGTIRGAVQAYLKHLDNVDAMLLVNLKADLETIPSSQWSAGFDNAAIGQALAKAVHDAEAAVGADMRGMVGREIVSYVAGEVISHAGTQFATSAGILSAGATSSTVTIGAGFVIALAIDYAVSWAYDRVVDPAGELSRKLDATLTNLEQLILVGDQNHPGLSVRLSEYASRRGQARNAAIASVVLK